MLITVVFSKLRDNSATPLNKIPLPALLITFFPFFFSLFIPAPFFTAETRIQRSRHVARPVFPLASHHFPSSRRGKNSVVESECFRRSILPSRFLSHPLLVFSATRSPSSFRRIRNESRTTLVAPGAKTDLVSGTLSTDGARKRVESPRKRNFRNVSRAIGAKLRALEDASAYRAIGTS